MKRLYAFCPFCLKSCFVLIYRVSAQIITLIISSKHFQNQNLLFLFTCILSLSCHWNLSSITEGTLSVQLTVLPNILKWSMTYVHGAQQIFARWMYAKYIFNLITFSFSFFFFPVGLSSDLFKAFFFCSFYYSSWLIFLFLSSSWILSHLDCYFDGEISALRGPLHHSLR